MRTLFCWLAMAAVPLSGNAWAQNTWQTDTRGASGPVAMVRLPGGGKTRVSMIAFEYLRRCDPIFSYAEFEGNRFGAPIGQERAPSAGGSVNGKRYSGPAAKTTYSNGFEIGFAVPNDMAMSLVFDDVRSLTFVTPTGAEVAVPTGGLKNAVDAALEHCTSRVK